MQRRLVLAAFASAAEICPENHCTVQVNSIKIFTHIPLLGDHAYVCPAHIVLCFVFLHPCGLLSHIHDSAQHDLLEIFIIEIHSS
jgi:hypothetical protein